MISFISKLTIIILVFFLIGYHWDAVAAFFGGIVDWILFYMDKIAVGPPR